MSTLALLRIGSLALLLFLVAPFASSRGSAASARLGPGSSLRITGTSSVHDYESRTLETSVEITRRAGSTAVSGGDGLAGLVRAAAIQSVDVKVPVRSLHSPRKGLDANLYKALKADAHPAITVHLDRYTTAAPASGDTIRVNASGTIRVAGVERPLTIEARLHRGDGGTWVTGRHTLRMSEFGIKPPTMMMGTLRVRDPVTIHFRLLLL
jgi:polyisoprenoid-binding protein YceI